jgi:hypothetical protein
MEIDWSSSATTSTAVAIVPSSSYLLNVTRSSNRGGGLDNSSFGAFGGGGGGGNGAGVGAGTKRVNSATHSSSPMPMKKGRQGGGSVASASIPVFFAQHAAPVIDFGKMVSHQQQYLN